MESKCSARHTDLPPYSIRLLHLNADIPHPNAGELVVVLLDEAPPYYALSHCWGRPGENTDILLGSTLISIQIELKVAIQRLRALAATTTAWLDPPLTYVWIDNICINQNDAQERSTQVQMMGMIYARAIRTLVWLGPEFSSSDAAWKLVDDVYDRFRAEAPAAQTLEDIPQCLYSDALHASRLLPSWDSPVWSSLRQLFDLRWFSRAWVIQEVVQSAQDPIMIHGQSLHSWHRLGWAAAWLRRKGYTRLPQVSPMTLNVDMLCLLRRSRVAWPLDALLSITQVKFHATDPRDKVWSMLGLAAECRLHGEMEASMCSVKTIPYELRPDYTLSTTQVYQRVGRYLLTHSCSLALLTRTRGLPGSLSRTRRTTELPDLPSWTPDLSDFASFNRHIRTSFSWIHYASDEKQQPPAVLGYPQNYAAAARTRLIIHDNKDVRDADDSAKAENRSVLRVSGILVTQIEGVVSLNTSPTCREQFYAFFDSTAGQIIQAAFSLLDCDLRLGIATRGGTDQEQETIESWVADLVQVTTADQQCLSGCTWTQCLQGGKQYLREILLSNREYILSRYGSSAASHAHHALLDRVLDYLKPDGDGTRNSRFKDIYVSVARNFCFNRTFFITEDGRMGLGPSIAQGGDIVVILFGGGVPFVLRPRQELVSQEQKWVGNSESKWKTFVRCDWQVVGESYVQGLMHGEAITASQQGLLREAILTLI